MNAPLPRHITESPQQLYERVASTSNEVAARLGARLRTETQGEVLFSAADRGRYASDASISKSRPWACLCRVMPTKCPSPWRFAGT